MKRLNKVVTVISKILEISYFVLTGFSTALTILCATGRLDSITRLSSINIGVERELSSNGFSIAVTDIAGNPSKLGYTLFFVTAIFVSFLMGMIFRNIGLIFKTSEGKTKFSQGATPFQKDNVRMVREIGIFCIAINVIEFIISNLPYIFGVELEASAEPIFLVVGIIILSLSQFFAYGVELQKDVDGLL